MINSQFFEPVPAEMLRTIIRSPIVTLKKNGLYATCSKSVCDYEIQA